MSIIRAVGVAAALTLLAVGAYSTAVGDVPSVAMQSPSFASRAAQDPAAASTGDKTNATDPTAADAREANRVLGNLKASYRYLDGVTVRMGNTPGGAEAVAYYTKGEIVISPKHSVDIDAILVHEIWHVIDWRDNGHLDWGERVPPENSSSYVVR